MSITSEWNPKQKRLKEIIRKPDLFEESKKLFISMHASVHFSTVNNSQEPTLMDNLWNDLQYREFAIMPTEKDVTIAWDIWHITRIEDLTVNILIDGSSQLLNEEWLTKLHAKITDTGNAMTDDQIIDFSKSIDINELKNYRSAVGSRTQHLLRNLTFEDMKRKFEKNSIDRIFEEGGVVEHPDSIWLLDFWGKKDVAGIILMPVTRHQVIHLNDGFHLKQAIRKKKEFWFQDSNIL